MDGEIGVRILPTNLAAEQAILSCLLANNRAYDNVAEFLRPEHFSEPVHGRIYQAIAALLDDNNAANVITLAPLFDNDASLAKRGGSAYLAKLSSAYITAINAIGYAQSVIDCYKRRQLIEIGNSMVEASSGSHSVEETADSIAQTAEEELFELSADGRRARRAMTAKEATDSALRQTEAAYRDQGRLTGVTTGITRLDRLLGGLQPGDLYFIGGRPSMGKTLLGDGIAVAAALSFARAADDGHCPHVLAFELEMTSEELAKRRLAARTRIDLEAIKRGQLDDKQFQQLIDASQSLGRLPILTDDTPRLTMAEIRARARRATRRKGGLGLLEIDHIGLVQPPRELASASRNDQITHTTQCLKALAKELNVPVVALSQLSREVEKREDKRPMLSDLRDSGSIEQDADAVMFVYREEYYLSRQPPRQKPGEKSDNFAARTADWEDALRACTNVADIFVEKQRNGPIGNVKCFFDGAKSIFGNLEQEEMPL